jgi:hypothetical protein
MFFLFSLKKIITDKQNLELTNAYFQEVVQDFQDKKSYNIRFEFQFFSDIFLSNRTIILLFFIQSNA